jgi:hypothetical protein
MGRPIAIDAVSIDPNTGQVLFFERGVVVEPLSARIEASYEREDASQKDFKITVQAPLVPDQLCAHPSRIIERFDHLFAIDTNTKESNGEIVSVTGIVHGNTAKVIIPGKTVLQLYKIHCIEFRGIQDKQENVAWTCLIQSLLHNPGYHPALQFGLIVDSDLSNLEMYNSRQLPVYGEFYLPGNMKFIYASSETRENLPNMMLDLADKESKRIRDYIIRERCNQGLIPVSNEPYTHIKKWDSTFQKTSDKFNKNWTWL